MKKFAIHLEKLKNILRLKKWQIEAPDVARQKTAKFAFISVVEKPGYNGECHRARYLTLTQTPQAQC